MISKYPYLSITVVMLILGFVIAGQIHAQTNSLNGTWVLEDEQAIRIGNRLEMRFNNGNFESLIDSVPLTKGTYTIKEKVMTSQNTNVYGVMFDLEPRWYSQNEIRAALQISFGQYMPEKELDELVNNMFLPENSIFSVNGNILTMRLEGETETVSYIKNE